MVKWAQSNPPESRKASPSATHGPADFRQRECQHPDADSRYDCEPRVPSRRANAIGTNGKGLGAESRPTPSVTRIPVALTQWVAARRRTDSRGEVTSAPPLVIPKRPDGFSRPPLSIGPLLGLANLALRGWLPAPTAPPRARKNTRQPRQPPTGRPPQPHPSAHGPKHAATATAANRPTALTGPRRARTNARQLRQPPTGRPPPPHPPTHRQTRGNRGSRYETDRPNRTLPRRDKRAAPVQATTMPTAPTAPPLRTDKNAATTAAANRPIAPTAPPRARTNARRSQQPPTGRRPKPHPPALRQTRGSRGSRQQTEHLNCIPSRTHKRATTAAAANRPIAPTAPPQAETNARPPRQPPTG